MKRLRLGEAVYVRSLSLVNGRSRTWSEAYLLHLQAVWELRWALQYTAQQSDFHWRNSYAWQAGPAPSLTLQIPFSKVDLSMTQIPEALSLHRQGRCSGVFSLPSFKFWSSKSCSPTFINLIQQEVRAGQARVHARQEEGGQSLRSST